MLQSVSVGPPMVGATDLKSSGEKPLDKDFKGTGSESSFGKALEDKMTSRAPKETKDSSAKDTKAREQDPEKPEDSKAKKTDAEVVRAENKPTKKTTGRQQAIQDFMDSFESEFKIPPTRLVEAMAELKDSQLVQSPEDTAQAVIDQLDLPADQEEKAQAMYASLLAQLNQMPVSPKAPTMMTGSGLSHAQVQERVMTAQSRQDMLLRSVDQLNQKFWSNPQSQQAQNPMKLEPTLGLQNLKVDEASLRAADLPMEGLEQQVPVSMPAAPVPKLEELPPHLRGQMKEAMSPALLAALAAKQAAAQQNSEGQSEGEPLAEEFQQAVQTSKVEGPAVTGNPSPSIYAQNKANAEFMENSSQDSSLMQQSSQQEVFAKNGRGQEGQDSEALRKMDFKHSLSGLEGLHGAPIKGEALKAEMAMPLAAAPQAAPGAPTQAENDAAVKQLMNQAQYLIKKGGGEMKVEMTPEGMGTVQLKVMLQDGKVNLQMSADTQEAKKTIESSLAELKTSLAAHKLSMENVKVDVVNSTSTDTSTQNQTNMNGQHQRDQQTRQFWNQFNDSFGSQGRKDSLMDMPSLRGYGRKRDPLQPIETASSAPARKVEGKGSGLNLVA